MSFQYLNYGEGFDVYTPTPAALRFGNLLEIRGDVISIVRLSKTGRDDYGQPVYSESSEEVKAFIEERPKEMVLRPGTLKLGSITAFLNTWASVGEEGYEVEINGIRYHIQGVNETRAYQELILERKTG